MKIQKNPFKKFVRRCSALYRWFTCYRKHVRMIEAELGDHRRRVLRELVVDAADEGPDLRARRVALRAVDGHLGVEALRGGGPLFDHAGRTRRRVRGRAGRRFGRQAQADLRLVLVGEVGGAGAAEGKKEDVVDAEFTEVDDDKKNKKSA